MFELDAMLLTYISKCRQVNLELLKEGEGCQVDLTDTAYHVDMALDAGYPEAMAKHMAKRIVELVIY